jgi:hypothetical protein
MNGVKVCGRPTTIGRPCRQRLHSGGGEVACRQHETPEEAAYRQGWWAGQTHGWKQGWAAGHASGQQAAAHEAARQEQATFRTEIAGQQIVQVGRYAYQWDGGEPLAIGDRVLLPANWLSAIKDGPGPFEGVVTQLGTSYMGPLSRIVRRLPTRT